MKFATSRLADKTAEETDQSDTVWLRRARVGAKRPGDLLVVVLSAGLILTLGLVVVIARLEPHSADLASSRVAAVQQPVMRTSPAAQAAPPPVAIASAPQNSAAAPAPTPPVANPPVTTPPAATPPAGGPVATPVAPRPVSQPITTASVPTAEPAAPAPTAALAPLAPPVVQPPLAQPVEVSRQAPPRASARFDPALAFAAPTFPTGSLPPELEAQAPQESAPEAVAEQPRQVARLAPETEPATPPARQSGAKAGEPVAKKGSAGATWAVYFDQFPDQAAAASRINALQGKYGPHLGGRRLTYTRSGDDWRMRVSGLTEDAAREICGKVKSAGSNCAVGGR